MFIVYKITNVLNSKCYIGVHKTDNLQDGYLGSGTVILNAKKKYGKENFKKEVLFIYEEEKGAYKKEHELVNAQFISSPTTYNLKRGGHGGWDYVNSLPGSSEYKRKGGKIAGVGTKKWTEESWRKVREQGKKNGVSQLNTIEAIEKRKRTIRENGSLNGKNNPMYGKIWISNGLATKRISKSESIPTGWFKGRNRKKPKRKSEMIWVNDGSTNKYIKQDSNLLEGFKRGRVVKIRKEICEDGSIKCIFTGSDTRDCSPSPPPT